MQRDLDVVAPLAADGEAGEDGHLLALDAKINLDDTALYRHPDLAAWRDITQEDAREAAARELILEALRREVSLAEEKGKRLFGKYVRICLIWCC